MKTGLVTFYHIHHYGALLQAAATERAVERLGGECEIVDYFVNQNNDLFRRPTGLGSAAADAHTALHYQALKTRYQRFEAFARRNLRISGHRFESLEELRAAELPYDVILAGSDQIWNPKIFPDGHFDPVFFGVFSQRRKIAYAPSFGVPRIPEGMEDELRGYLAAFSHLSVRERQGQKIVEDIAGKTVPVVLDPTLLLTRDQWAAMANTPSGYPSGGDLNTPRGYILCYCISRPDALAPYIQSLADRDRPAGGPTLRRPAEGPSQGPVRFGRRPGGIPGAVPKRRLCLHQFLPRTVFSVQFQKPFFTAVAPGELAEPESSRTFSLLSTLGLTERIIGKGDTAGLDAGIDWAAVEARLDAARQSSLDYLRAALAGEETAEAPGPQAAEGGLPVLADHTRCTGLRRLHERLPQGCHHHGPGQGGLCLPGHRQGEVRPLRTLHRRLSHPA